MKFRIDIRDVHVDIQLFYPFMVLALSDPEQTIVWVRTERGNGEYRGKEHEEGKCEEKVMKWSNEREKETVREEEEKVNVSGKRKIEY
jgi:hypothetical protein